MESPSGASSNTKLPAVESPTVLGAGRVPRLPILGSLFAGSRRARRWLNRTRWSSRFLRLPADTSEGEPGLIMVQIDGLSRKELERALADGRMPFLRRLLSTEGYRLESLYSGLPATTPAVQAELFYGVKSAVPAFSYLSHRLGRVVRMVEADAAEEVQQQATSQHCGLFDRGSACTNIYTGGSAEPRFCAAAAGWGEIFGRASPLGILLFTLINGWSVLRAIGRTFIELAAGIGGALWGSLRGFNLWREIKFIPSRVAIGILLRDIATIAAAMDTVRGLPVIQVNYLGYDERSHRRGPESRFAHASLSGIDRCIERLWHAGHDSSVRMYSLWVYADHGQEHTTPYEDITGRTITDVVADLTGIERTEEETRQQRAYNRPGSDQRTRYMRRSRKPSAQKPTPAPDDSPRELEVIAIGPLGHIYFREPRSPEMLAQLARQLTTEANVPLALLRNGDRLQAWTPHGEFELPRDAAQVFGADHPFLEMLSADLMVLLRHPDAGHLVIGGWSRDQQPVSFVGENGAHAGVGPNETHAFALLPSYVVAPRAEDEPLRPLGLREAALRYLGRTPAVRHRRVSNPSRRLRVVTYNVHSCVGLDERLSPSRIARVLAHCQADVIALQEIDVRRARSGHVDQATEIAERLGMHCTFFPVLSREGEQYGDALLSHLPFEVVKTAGLPLLPNRTLEPRGALWATFDLLGQPLQIINTHLGLVAAEQSLQIDALLGPEWLAHAACCGPVILCGDLNLTPRSANYRRLAARLADAQRHLKGHKPQATWISNWPRLQIDHVLVSHECQVRAVQTIRSRLSRVASDHLPLAVDIELA